MKKVTGAIWNYIKITDKWLLLLVLTCSGFGMLLIYSARLYQGDSMRYVGVQGLATLIGLTAAIIISNIDYHLLSRFWWFFGAVTMILMVVTYFIGVGPETSGDKAWIVLPGGMSLQPAELMKIAFVISFPYHAEKVRDHIDSPLVVLGLIAHGMFPVGLVVLQGDIGMALVFFLMFLMMFLFSGVKLRYILGLVTLFALSVPVVWFKFLNDDHRERLISVYFPQLDTHDRLYQQNNGMVALGNGGIFGKGLFQGPLNLRHFVPKNHNDFILTVVGEELGLIGCAFLFLLLFALCVRFLRISARSKDTMGSLMCLGVFTVCTVQALMNIGMVLKLLPVVGLTLPFISYGGSSVVTLYVLVGLALSVYTHRETRMFAGD